MLSWCSRRTQDRQHPAFIKLFVQTEFVPELDALIAHRRARSENEAPIWAGHFAVGVSLGSGTSLLIRIARHF